MLNETEGNGALPKARSVLFVWEHSIKSLPSSSRLRVLRVIPLFWRSSAPSELSYFTAQLFPPPCTGLVLQS